MALILLRVTSVSSWHPDRIRVWRSLQLLLGAVIPRSVMDWVGGRRGEVGEGGRREMEREGGE